MKTIIGLLLVIVLAGAMESQAQNTPTVDQRQKKQRQRIHGGVASGELTRQEASDARQDQRSIRRIERRAKADGVVTGSERAKLHHKQNKASRELRRDKHNRQERPKEK
jgi:uncharacterized membrane protein YebE (DUF533 family)